MKRFGELCGLPRCAPFDADFIAVQALFCDGRLRIGSEFHKKLFGCLFSRWNCRRRSPRICGQMLGRATRVANDGIHLGSIDAKFPGNCICQGGSNALTHLVHTDRDCDVAIPRHFQCCTAAAVAGLINTRTPHPCRSDHRFPLSWSLASGCAMTIRTVVLHA